jgi:hypothetical protein
MLGNGLGPRQSIFTYILNMPFSCRKTISVSAFYRIIQYRGYTVTVGNGYNQYIGASIIVCQEIMRGKSVKKIREISRIRTVLPVQERNSCPPIYWRRDQSGRSGYSDGSGFSVVPAILMVPAFRSFRLF